MAKLTGTNPDQVPTNADLGTMAYQDKDNLQVGDVEATGLNVIQGADTTTTVVIGGGDQARLVINGDRDNDGDGGTEDAVLVFDVDGAYNPDTNSGLGKYGFRIGARNRAGATDLKFTETRASTDYEHMRITSNGNVGIGDTNPDSHYGGEYRLVVRDNQDAMSRMGLTNSNSASGAGVEYRWISGTGNSNMAHALYDNNGAPFARLSMGSAVINYDIFIDGTQAFLIRGSNKEVVIPSGKLELDGNDIGGTQVTIADDAVASITPPRNGGFMFITCAAGGDYPSNVHSGMLYYDVGASLYSSLQTTGGVSASLDVSTSDVTGTTGTDGNVTVAMQSGVIKVENRLGNSTSFSITFL